MLSDNNQKKKKSKQKISLKKVKTFKSLMGRDQPLTVMGPIFQAQSSNYSVGLFSFSFVIKTGPSFKISRS